MLNVGTAAILQGKNPYVIPVGGSSALGTWGYLEAAREMEEQLQAAAITDIALVSQRPCWGGQSMPCDFQADLWSQN